MNDLEGRAAQAGGEENVTGISTLSTSGLVKVYRGRKVVRGVSIDIRQGEIVGLLGPNGAGKTTTFYMVVGLTQPDEGSVLLGGEEITALPMYMRAQRGISYLPQEPSIFRKLTVEENLLAVFEMMGLPLSERDRRTRKLLEEFGVAHIARSRGYALSGGERRRVEIARSLAINPSFILLDEPFAGIDPIAVLEIQGIISRLKARGIGILITDHNVRETLKITDRAYIIKEGEIFRQGPPQELSSDAEVRRIYLGEGFNLH
jgi:lipopolysaccharide export system ATP-binding protein